MLAVILDLMDGKIIEINQNNDRETCKVSFASDEDEACSLHADVLLNHRIGVLTFLTYTDIVCPNSTQLEILNKINAINGNIDSGAVYFDYDLGTVVYRQRKNDCTEQTVLSELTHMLDTSWFIFSEIRKVMIMATERQVDHMIDCNSINAIQGASYRYLWYQGEASHNQAENTLLEVPIEDWDRAGVRFSKQYYCGEVKTRYLRRGSKINVFYTLLLVGAISLLLGISILIILVSIQRV